jgi:hypothetical protein
MIIYSRRWAFATNYRFPGTGKVMLNWLIRLLSLFIEK